MRRRAMIVCLTPLLATAARAQSAFRIEETVVRPTPVRLRGTIVGLTDNSISIDPGDGIKEVQMNRTLPVMAVRKARMSGLVTGAHASFATRLDTDGHARAFSVLLFDPAFDGQFETSYDSELGPDVRMHGGTIEKVQVTHDGQRMITLKTMTQMQTVMVPSDVRVGALGVGKRDDLKKGLPVLLIGVRADSGKNVALRVAVGVDGHPPAL